MSGATIDRWALPVEIGDVEVAFPANALEYMPSCEECEAGLRQLEPKVAKMWRDFQQAWFFDGLPASVEFELAEGVDGEKAIRHLKMIQGSFAPKHEHKEAAVAYLASRWFTTVRNFERARS
jgi:hypothetical protein